MYEVCYSDGSLIYRPSRREISIDVRSHASGSRAVHCWTSWRDSCRSLRLLPKRLLLATVAAPAANWDDLAGDWWAGKVAAADSSFFWVSCLLTSTLHLASYLKKNGQTPLDVLANWGDFFPESLVALPGDDEGEEVFDLRKVRSMEKSSPEMRSGHVFFGRLLFDGSMFYGKIMLFWKDEMKPSYEKTDTVYMKLLFVFFGDFLWILPWDSSPLFTTIW